MRFIPVLVTSAAFHHCAMGCQERSILYLFVVPIQGQFSGKKIIILALKAKEEELDHTGKMSKAVLLVWRLCLIHKTVQPSLSVNICGGYLFTEDFHIKSCAQNLLTSWRNSMFALYPFATFGSMCWLFLQLGNCLWKDSASSTLYKNALCNCFICCKNTFLVLPQLKKYLHASAEVTYRLEESLSKAVEAQVFPAAFRDFASQNALDMHLWKMVKSTEHFKH